AFVDAQFVDHVLSPLVLAVETRREATALVIDMAGERGPEMTRQQSRTPPPAVFQRRPSALARPAGRGAREALPLRVWDLEGVSQDVAAEQRLLAARFELDGDGAGRMAGGGLHLDVLVELGGTVDHLRQAGFDHGQDRIAERSGIGRRGLWIVVDLEIVLVVG